MKHGIKKTALAMMTLLLIPMLQTHAGATTLQCENKNFTIQLLGSGGPISDDQRASSGEIIWWKGKSAVLMDAGGGVFLRLGQSGARVEDLKLLALSHFHTDHVSDVPAILKGAYFFSDNHQLKMVGPMSGGLFPSATKFFDDLFNKDNGAFAYLHGLSNASDGLKLAVNVEDVDYRSETPVTVYDQDGLKITAFGIPHGDVPCLAYRFETAEGVIVVSADQNGSRKGFVDFAKGADILVMPAAIDENADSASKFLHATPDIIGKIAAQVNPKLLVLNHFMGKSLVTKSDTVEIIKKYFHGDISTSRDLSCYPMDLIKKSERK